MTRSAPAVVLPGDWHESLRRGIGVVAEIRASAHGFSAQGLAEATLSPKGSHPGAFFFLESQGDLGSKRISLMAGDPLFSFLARGNRGVWHSGGLARDLESAPDQVFATLGRVFGAQGVSENEPGLTPLMGWLSYEAGAAFDRQPVSGEDPVGLPDWYLMLPGEWCWFDPEMDVWRFRLSLAGSAFYKKYERALGLKGSEEGDFPLLRVEEMIEEWRGNVAKRLDRAVHNDSQPSALARPRRLEVTDSSDRKRYCETVQRAKEYIAAGDIFQVNLSHRLSAPYSGKAWDLYRRLGQINPSPFAAFADLGSYQIVSASPERLFLQDGDRVETHPIAGTIPRSAASAGHSISEKERAEHVMTVDIERNDLSRVCEPGSVKVENLMKLESASHVHHLVSRVEGRLRDGKDLADLFRAAFPGGSVTGAPKVRCMQVIAELEKGRRGVYTGSLGFWDPIHKKAGFNMLIRTILLCRGRAWWQVGGGIVADSDPDLEWEETMQKGAALRLALETSPR
ncbi:MAG: anthranilate synthase component I family protein [candidate division FCPU426 bacterium]